MQLLFIVVGKSFIATSVIYANSAAISAQEWLRPLLPHASAGRCCGSGDSSLRSSSHQRWASCAVVNGGCWKWLDVEENSSFLDGFKLAQPSDGQQRRGHTAFLRGSGICGRTRSLTTSPPCCRVLGKPFAGSPLRALAGFSGESPVVID